ncbi:MAG: hypothetical protein IT235_04175 [Bacteroidia bacterium]|nr:hypothetical protein [Bacteroidia bacterium]
MVFLYMGIGVLFIFSSVLMNLVPENRTLLGAVFIVYGLFRTIITLRKIKKLKREGPKATNSFLN